MKTLRPFVAVILGLGLGLAVTKIAGESPWHVLQVLIKSAVGSRYDLGMTLYYSTPLIFTGLSVAMAFHAGLFNIGAEGQLTLGALATAIAGILMPNLPGWMAPAVATLAGFALGGLYGAIPGWLRARRGSHEVINTIMLNFVAAGVASWVTLHLFRNPDSQNTETRVIGAGYSITQWHFFNGAPVGWAFLFALLVALLVWIFLWKTVIGFEIRAMGQNETAAKVTGMNVPRLQILALALAGGLAGLVGVSEVLGNSQRFKLDFSPDYGFIGIAVALLGRNRPLGIVASALLFGALHKGAADLDLETNHVTKDLSLILQAFVILSVSAEGLYAWFGNAFKKRAAS